MARQLTCVFLLVLVTGFGGTRLAGADVPVENHAARKVVKKVLPAYPELARQFNIRGAVRLLVSVDSSGKVKSAKAVGGNPTLVAATMGVIGKWKFEPAEEQTTETVEIKFEPTE